MGDINGVFYHLSSYLFFICLFVHLDAPSYVSWLMLFDVIVQCVFISVFILLNLACWYFDYADTTIYCKVMQIEFTVIFMHYG